MTVFDQGSQKERAAIMKGEAGLHPSQRPPAPDTYFARAQRQQPDQAEPSLTIPALPPSSPWHHDPVGKEPPLGFAIDEVGEALGGASPKPGGRR
jgi:hypothetical protein